MKLTCKGITKNSNMRGSSSVLVIMIMLLLITFGVLAMMSSYSSLKIARKNADWTKGYYALESQAELSVRQLAVIYKEAIKDADTNDEGTILSRFYAKYAADPLFEKHIDATFDASGEVISGREPELTILSENEADGRTMLVTVRFQSTTNTPFEIIEFREVPKEFIYDEGLEFNDPGDNN